MRWLVGAAFLLVVWPGDAAPPAGRRLDQVVIRFYAAETRGIEHPRWITERWLGFEAHLHALAEGASSVHERYIRLAIETHIGEELLANTAVETPFTTEDLASTTREVRSMIENRVGGPFVFRDACREAGLDERELEAWFLRKARSLLYIDRMMVRLLRPPEPELRALFRSGAHPYRGDTYETARDSLRRWWLFDRYQAAVASFFQGARARVNVVIVDR